MAVKEKRRTKCGALLRPKGMEIEERLNEVSRLRRRGHSVEDVATMMNLSIQKVYLAIRKIYKKYEAQQVESRGAYVQEQLDKLADVRLEAWKAWERSQLKAEKVVEELGCVEDDDGGFAESLHRMRIINTVEGRIGENAYLVTILRTFEAERQLLGLDAPKQVNAEVKVNVQVWETLLKGIAAPVESAKPALSFHEVDAAGIQESVDELVVEADAVPQEGPG